MRIVILSSDACKPCEVWKKKIEDEFDSIIEIEEIERSTDEGKILTQIHGISLYPHTIVYDRNNKMLISVGGAGKLSLKKIQKVVDDMIDEMM